jgi:hypothetical protein
MQKRTGWQLVQPIKKPGGQPEIQLLQFTEMVDLDIAVQLMPVSVMVGFREAYDVKPYVMLQQASQIIDDPVDAVGQILREMTDMIDVEHSAAAQFPMLGKSMDRASPIKRA